MTVVKYEMQPVTDDHQSPSDAHALVSVTWFEKGKWRTGKFDPDLLTEVE